MAQQDFPGSGIWLPPIWLGVGAPALISATAMTATSHLTAFCGRVFWVGSGNSKDIRKLHFPWGTITKTGGSGMTVSLQGVDASVGQPLRPDGVIGQSVNIANGDASFVTNGYQTTGNFSSDRTVAKGEMLAVVIGYDASGRQGSDSVVVRGGQSTASTTFPTYMRQTQISYYNGTSWASVTGYPLIILEFSDGTFGVLNMNAYPFASVSTYIRNSGSSPNNEIGGLFVPPVDMVVDGVWGMCALNNTNVDISMVVYDSALNVLRTVTVDASQVASTQPSFELLTFEELTLTGGQTYYVTYLPTTGNNASFYTLNAAAAGHLAAWPGGTACMMVQRGGGAFSSPSTTDRFLGGFHVKSQDVGGGGGGGTVIPPFSPLLKAA